jgi:hypothetical protein
MNAEFITVLAGMSLLVPAWIGRFLIGIPVVISPKPALTIIPAFYLDQVPLGRAVVLIPTLLFFAWNPGLFKGNCKIPIRTPVLFLLAGTLDVIWFVGGWNYGLQYQGPHAPRILLDLPWQSPLEHR